MVERSLGARRGAARRRIIEVVAARGLRHVNDARIGVVDLRHGEPGGELAFDLRDEIEMSRRVDREREVPSMHPDLGGLLRDVHELPDLSRRPSLKLAVWQPQTI